MRVYGIILSTAAALVLSPVLHAQGSPFAQSTPSAQGGTPPPAESAAVQVVEADSTEPPLSTTRHGDSSVHDDRSCVYLAYGGLAADPRIQHVREFLERHSCQTTHLAPSFLLAAEINGLDYRLLPTLAVLESGCGRATKNYNLFGWANGRTVFASFEQGIHFVAQRLRLAPHYRNKTTIEKLRVYNRRASYRAKVLRLMESIGAGEGEAAGSTDKSRRTASGNSR